MCGRHVPLTSRFTPRRTVQPYVSQPHSYCAPTHTHAHSPSIPISLPHALLLLLHLHRTNNMTKHDTTQHNTTCSPYKKVMGGGFADGDVHWFTEGKVITRVPQHSPPLRNHSGAPLTPPTKLNAAYNCVDRHLPSRADQAAIIWESDERGEGRTITYAELHKDVCRIANVMKKMGIVKVALFMGDRSLRSLSSYRSRIINVIPTPILIPIHPHSNTPRVTW